MGEPRLLETREVRLDEITIGKRLRPVSPQSVSAIAASFVTIGAQIGAVGLRRKGDALLLLCGGHRVAAARELGRETVRADIWECTDQIARFFEVHENLASAELSTLEAAQFLAEAKQAYEDLHPTTKAGVINNLARWGLSGEHVPFREAMAEKRGVSPSMIGKLERAGRRLDPAAADALRLKHKAPTIRDLAAICRLDAQGQRAAAEVLWTEVVPIFLTAWRPRYA